MRRKGNPVRPRAAQGQHVEALVEQPDDMTVVVDQPDLKARISSE
jgi:hypothetical protein